MRLRLGLLAVIALSPVYANDQADAILGSWRTPDDESTIEIYRCGEQFCGKIVALKEPVYGANDKHGMAGKAKVDRENPTKEKRTQPIIGLVLMKGFSHKKKQWAGGTIYDPNNGKTYKCRMRLKDDGKTLEVRGYVGIPTFGRTSIWKR